MTNHVCCFCGKKLKKIKHMQPPDGISDGVCKKCKKDLLKELEKELKKEFNKKDDKELLC